MVEFSEYFDDISNTDDLFDAGPPLRWSDSHPAESSSYFGINSFAFSTAQKKSGTQSLLFTAVKTSGSETSKASIIRDSVVWKEGDTVTFSTYFYIPSGQTLADITIMDLEARTIWDDSKNSQSNQSPGLRVQFTSAEYLKIDRGKIGYSEHFTQETGSEVAVPRDQWTQIALVCLLGTGTSGNTKLYIDGVKVIDEDGTNFPDRDYFLSLSTPIYLLSEIFYDSIEVGVSANPQTDQDVSLYVDNVEVAVVYTNSNFDTSPDRSQPVRAENRENTITPDGRTG